MSLVTEKFTRKPFDIEAVRVTAGNMEAVAEWCGGEIIQYNGKRCIKVDVAKPLMEKQTRAFIGDWVLFGNGFKVYTNKAFRHCFVKKEDEQLPLFEYNCKCPDGECMHKVKPFSEPNPNSATKPNPKIHMPARYPEPSTR